MAVRKAVVKYPEEFPALDKSGRYREFIKYSDIQRASVAWHWLTTDMFTRELDTKDLGLDGNSSHGYQSFGIYRYLGLNGSHHGFFKGCTTSEVLTYMMNLTTTNEEYSVLTFYLILYVAKCVTTSSKDISSANITYLKDSYVQDWDQFWIRKNLIADASPNAINNALLSLPETESIGHVLVGNVYTEYTNHTVQSTIKDLYDFHCQICDSQAHKHNWKKGMLRQDEWLTLDADIHFIHPLSQQGSPYRENMLCLCPECRRKLESNQYRLLNKNDKILCVDELNGRREYLTQYHPISLS